VTVSGVIASVCGNEFAANYVPLQEGENTLAATAADTDGNTAETSVTVNAMPADRYVMLICDTFAAVPPFDAELELKAAFAFTEPPLFTYTGPGTALISRETDRSICHMEITAEGLYFVTAEVRDRENRIYRDTFAVEAADKAGLQALLDAKWQGMRTALLQKDIGKAAGYFSEASETPYRNVFAGLPDNILQEMVSDTADVRFVGMRNFSAEYDLRRRLKISKTIQF